MGISKLVSDVLLYISGAMARIFGPTDDAYPETGVQPYEGEPSNKKRSLDW